MSRAGALQGARGIKSILSGKPSPSRAFLPPQDRVQGLARKRPPPDNETTPKRYPGNAHNATESAPGRLGYQKYCFRIPSTKPRLLARAMARGPPKRPPPDNETTPKRYPGNARGTSGSAPGRPGYQKYSVRTPLNRGQGSPSTDPRQTTKRPPNDTLETRMARAGALQGAQGINSIVFGPPRTVVRGSPSTNRRQRTKRHPNDSLETRMARAGALQGARGIKSILSGPPSPSRAFLPPQDRVQGLARKRAPPGNETTPKRPPPNNERPPLEMLSSTPHLRSARVRNIIIV